MGDTLPDVHPLVGRTLGEFTLRDKIGEGGFAVVHRAYQAALDRDAVIKILHTRLASRTDVIQRFLREARLASRLDHPYAVHVYAFGAEPDGMLWIAMEMVRGTPMDRLLDDGQLAAGHLKLSGNQGLMVSSGKSHIETLENEAEVFAVIRNTRDWKRHWRVVCQVRVVNDALLLFSERKNQNLEVSLQDNKIASVRGGTLSVQRSPVNGALYVSCARPRWFLGAAPMDPSAAIERCMPSIDGEPDEPDDPED